MKQEIAALWIRQSGLSFVAFVTFLLNFPFLRVLCASVVKFPLLCVRFFFSVSPKEQAALNDGNAA